MTTLSKAVQDAIALDLPGIAANELKEFIIKAEADAKALMATQISLNGANEEIKSLKAQLAQHRALDEREIEIAKAAAANQEKELSLLKREAFMEAKIAQAELTGVKDTVSQFLRNTTVRSTVVADVSKPVDGCPAGGGSSYGSPGMLMRNNDGKLDTTTTERTEE